MAFSSTIVSRGNIGMRRVISGTFDSAGVTEGNISTSLSSIDSVSVSYSTVRASSTVAISSGTVTLAGLTSGDTGTFIAVGL